MLEQEDAGRTGLVEERNLNLEAEVKIVRDSHNVVRVAYFMGTNRNVTGDRAKRAF